MAVEHLGLPHQAEAEMGQAGEQLPERAWIDHIEIEFAVIDRGVLGDGQSAAVIAAVADADLIDRRRPARRVIDFQLDKERLKSPRRLHQADGVSEHTPGSLERLGLPLDHLRGNPDARHVEVRPAVGEADIDLMLASAQGDLGGFERVGGQGDGPREVVGGAQWEHRERLLQLEQRRQCLGQRAVAAADDDAVGPGAMRLEQRLQVLLLVGDHQDGACVLGEPFGELGQRRLGAGGIRVDDDEQAGFLGLHGEATSKRPNRSSTAS